MVHCSLPCAACHRHSVRAATFTRVGPHTPAGTPPCTLACGATCLWRSRRRCSSGTMSRQHSCGKLRVPAIMEAAIAASVGHPNLVRCWSGWWLWCSALLRPVCCCVVPTSYVLSCVQVATYHCDVVRVAETEGRTAEGGLQVCGMRRGTLVFVRVHACCDQPTPRATGMCPHCSLLRRRSAMLQGPTPTTATRTSCSWCR
jgi:hypothetical protein